jgi:phosphoribosylformimino-5-aminoimidazole carboxamide ribotide isomerase
MNFRPCIDLHNGIVKQIIGSTLTDKAGDSPETNFQAEKPAEWFAELYRKDNLPGGHIIKLGPGNEDAARKALQAWPGGMQIGGNINIDNAKEWLDAGAGAVIVTSWIFHDGKVDRNRLEQLTQSIGKNRLVLDLSCRKQGNDYKIVTDRWQTFTDEAISTELLDFLADFCFEFLIHGVDAEGKCQGIEMDLVKILGKWAYFPVTYAGGIRSMEDIEKIEHMGNGHIDFTVGSALDIFGGNQLEYKKLVKQFL